MGKYTSKKNGTSHYPERLESRGLSPAQVRMPFYDKNGRKHPTMASAQNANGKHDRSNYREEVSV